MTSNVWVKCFDFCSHLAAGTDLPLDVILYFVDTTIRSHMSNWTWFARNVLKMSIFCFACPRLDSGWRPCLAPTIASSISVLYPAVNISMPNISYHTYLPIGWSLHTLGADRPLTESSIPWWRTVWRCFCQEFLRAPARPRPSLTNLPGCAIKIMALNRLPQPLTLVISSRPSE